MANAIDKIPNSISGDGSSFVAQLKNALADLRADVETLDEGNTAQNCQSVSMVTLTQRKQGDDNFIDVAWEKSGVYGYKEAFVFYRPINSAKWQLSFVTEGVSGVIRGVSVGVRYAVKVVPHNIDGGYDKNPKTYTIEIVSSMITPNMPDQFLVTFDGGIGHWEWRYEGNDYDFFELRTDDKPGVMNENLIARTSDKEVFAEPNKLMGTAYLYVRNNFGMYSSPVTHTYNISQEGLPPKPTVAKEVNGVAIYMTENIDYESYVVQVEENEYATTDNPFFYQRTSGVIKVRYRWADDEDGNMSEWSNWSTINISGLIMGDDISANAIKASHLFAGNIDLAGKLAIVGGAVTLNENGLTCTNNIGDSVVFNESGMHNIDTNGNEFSAVKRIVMGEASNGSRVTFNKPFNNTPLVICVPKTLQVTNSSYAQANIFQKTFASDISTTGFKVNCYTTLAAGASNVDAVGIVYKSSVEKSDWTLASKSGSTSYTSSYAIGKREPTSASITVSYGSFHAKYFNMLDTKFSGVCNPRHTVTFSLLVDGVTAWTQTYSFVPQTAWEDYGEGGSTKVDVDTVKIESTVINNVNIPANAILTININVSRSSKESNSIYTKYWRFGANDSSSVPCCALKLESIAYATSEESIIDEGVASFIASDTDEYYSVGGAT